MIWFVEVTIPKFGLRNGSLELCNCNRCHRRRWRRQSHFGQIVELMLKRTAVEQGSHFVGPGMTVELVLEQTTVVEGLGL